MFGTVSPAADTFNFEKIGREASSDMKVFIFNALVIFQGGRQF